VARENDPPRRYCVLDSGALSALCGRSTRARNLLRGLLSRDFVVAVPTPVLVECTTGDGGRDAEINRVLNVLKNRGGAALPAPDEAMARRAGQLRYRAGTDDGIDALVAAAATTARDSSVVLTADPDDLEKLLAEHPEVTVIPV
jgi:hypothetical protein